ncbi:CPBP family intramembrane glutamic endopeptidase [Luteolibacter algae]|uniref:CPBP family intramembrane glutamic endopeptidase n=1 Tax=Luteolibacter algae TaxID=454151 RepID=A0ABW5D3T2_9BACT
MTRFLKSEAGAIVLWLAAALFAAALFTPYLYDAGKTLAESAETKDYPAVIESIAGSAERAKLDRFFSRALLISALVFLPVLIRRVKRIPRRKDLEDYALRKLSWPERLLHLGAGILIGACVLGGLAIVLNLLGASVPDGGGLEFGKIFSKAFLPALGAGLIEELVFRGLLLGLWLRACSLWTAWIGSSVMFSFLHFLKPPRGLEIADPRSWHSGFEILGSTLGHFTNPLFFVTDFATLTLLGLILAWCRTRTYALWLPIGIHAGLVFALKTFSMTQNLNPESPLNPWFIGSDLKSGILPLFALGICFLICILFVRKNSCGK